MCEFTINMLLDSLFSIIISINIKLRKFHIFNHYYSVLYWKNDKILFFSCNSLERISIFLKRKFDKKKIDFSNLFLQKFVALFVIVLASLANVKPSPDKKNDH